MTEEIIETLFAEKGKRYEEDGQAIASYGRRIVFLPKEAEPGQRVRVRLIEIEGKADVHGRSMYQAEPAPVEYTERWKDNGDGTASRVRIAIDWQFQETEAEVIEARELGQCEGQALIRTKHSGVFWGSSLTNSYVEEVEVRVIPIEDEIVKDGKLQWRESSEREEKGQSFRWPITRVELENALGIDPLAPEYEPEWGVTIFFQKLEEEKSFPLFFDSPGLCWRDIPSSIQNEVQDRYPLCACDRQRRDNKISDGYSKCELCRAEEICKRCGKQTKISMINGRLVCESCRPYEEQEQLIASHLSLTYRQRIADEAKELLTGQSLDAETGLAILKASLGHVSEFTREQLLLRRWKKYRWFYFTEEGVFGTKFEPAALQILQDLPQAVGNSLVELVAWIIGRTEVTNLDFYLASQVEGREVKIQLKEPKLEKLVRELDKKPVLADWLRGSEADRRKALAELAKAKEELGGEEEDRIADLLSKARRLLEDDKQDYTLVRKTIKEAYAEANRRRVLNDLLAEEYKVCPMCGDELEYANHLCREQEKLWAKGRGQDFLVKVSKIGDTELVKLVAEYDNRYDDYETRLVIDDSVKISAWEIKTESFWQEPSAHELELAKALQQAQAKLECLEDELSRCEGEYPSRVKVTFRQGIDPKGRLQLQAEGVFSGTVDNRKAEEGYSDYTEQQMLYVCRQHCDWLDEENQPQAGQTWICSIGFQIGMDRGGQPITVVNPQVRVDEEPELRSEIIRLRQELTAEQEN